MNYTPTFSYLRATVPGASRGVFVGMIPSMSLCACEMTDGFHSGCLEGCRHFVVGQRVKDGRGEVS